MKKIVIYIVYILVIVCSYNCRNIDNNNLPVEGMYDTIIVEDVYRIDSLTNVNDSLNLINDSLVDCNNFYCIVIDSLNEELFIANYKLERIREYNKIAAKGNNITFLRGWINRVLDE